MGLSLGVLVAVLLIMAALVTLVHRHHRAPVPVLVPDVLDRLEAHGAWLDDVQERLGVERTALEELEDALRAQLVAADAAAQTRGYAYGRRATDAMRPPGGAR
jgi:hypothetical protein